jgi:hypothetical protein
MDPFDLVHDLVEGYPRGVDVVNGMSVDSMHSQCLRERVGWIVRERECRMLSRWPG